MGQCLFILVGECYPGIQACHNMGMLGYHMSLMTWTGFFMGETYFFVMALNKW